MDLLKQYWPLLAALLLVVVVIRRMRGEPLDLKDAVTAPAIMLFLGVRTIIEVHPTAVDLAWLVALSVVSVLFGAARSATTVIERRGDQLFQRYRWRTLGLMVGSLVASMVLGLLAQRLGLHAEARPLTFSIGVGLAGESAVTLLRAARHGARMPWTDLRSPARS